jgi:hypothetical protein
MDAAAREALGRLVEGADVELLGDARRIRGLLQDTCPQSRREVMTLVAVVEEGLPLRLRQLPAGGMVPEELGRLAAGLARAQGLDPVVASWAVGAWAWALGVGPIPAEEQAPVAELERTPAEGGAGLRPPQRPPPSPPTPEVTQDRERPKRRRPVPLAAAIAVGILLAGGIVVVAYTPAPPTTTTSPTLTTRGAATTSVPLPPGVDAVLFHEDFSSPSDYWGAGNRSEGSVRFAQGAYRFHATQKRKEMQSLLQKFALTSTDTRVRIEASARRLAGATDAGYGIVWRIDPSTGSFYQAEIRDNGTYVIQKNLRGRWQRPVLAFGSEKAVINKGKVNHLRLDCTGGQERRPVTVSLSVNGHVLAKVVDRREPLAPAGEVGLVIATYGHAPVDVEFDDFAIYAI